MNNPYFHKNHPPTAKEKFNTFWKACAFPFILFANWFLRLFIKKQPRPIVIGVICPHQHHFERMLQELRFINPNLKGFEFVRISAGDTTRGRYFDLLINGPLADKVHPDVITMAVIHTRQYK